MNVLMTCMQFDISHDPVFHIIIDDFLGEEKNKKIFDHILSLKNYFKPAGTGTKRTLNKSMRTNLTCYLDSLFRKYDALGNRVGDRPARKAFRAEKSPLLAAGQREG